MCYPQPAHHSLINLFLVGSEILDTLTFTKSTSVICSGNIIMSGQLSQNLGIILKNDLDICKTTRVLHQY